MEMNYDYPPTMLLGRSNGVQCLPYRKHPAGMRVLPIGDSSKDILFMVN